MASYLTLVVCSSTPPLTRPEIITSAQEDDLVHYFGVGSNMLKSKLVNRGLNGGKIETKSFRPAVVHGHRLAFNMRGFPPLEPGMGALEPDDSPEAACHGALCTMTAREYDKVWRSEGGGSPKPGYEEIVVRAQPYGSTESVAAIALRARAHARLRTDACPSERYMTMLIQGATELGLEASYLDALRAQPTQQPGPLLRALAIHYLFLVTTLFRLQMQGMVRALSWLLWCVYVPPTCKHLWKRLLGDAATGLLLLPGAAVGGLIRAWLHVRGQPVPPMLALMITKPQEDESAASVSSKV